MERKYKIKPNQAKECPKCGNTTDFIMHSEQCSEDCCDLWVSCGSCSYDPTEDSTGDRIEDTWGGVGYDDFNLAISVCWNEIIKN